MSQSNNLILILLIFLSIYGLKAQNNDQNWEKIKGALKENTTPNWNYCSIDGRLDFRSFADSINRYSVLLPKHYNSITYKTDEFIVHQYKNKDDSNDSPILEIKVGPVISEKIDIYFDRQLKETIYSKNYRDFGRIELNGNESYWIESQENNESRILSFYLINQKTSQIFILTINSFRKRKFDIDYCVFTNYFRNIEWLE
jgi:hypothetical protein